MQASHSIRRRAIAALVGAAIAASLTAAMAVRHHEGDLAARKGWKGGQVLAGGILTGAGKPTR
jgi:hypothetical protein